MALLVPSNLIKNQRIDLPMQRRLLSAKSMESLKIYGPIFLREMPSKESPSSSPEGLAVLRHSTAHVMAQAVQQIFAQTRLGIGPPITDGFYYDFDPENPFNPDDLEKIRERNA
jgi:threonyl-tRNA synthetase